jgi:phytoene/squalene synthetase
MASLGEDAQHRGVVGEDLSELARTTVEAAGAALGCGGSRVEVAGAPARQRCREGHRDISRLPGDPSAPAAARLLLALGNDREARFR